MTKNIILHLHLGAPKRSLYSSFSDQNAVCISHLCHACCMSCYLILSF